MGSGVYSDQWGIKETNKQKETDNDREKKEKGRKQVDGREKRIQIL